MKQPELGIKISEIRKAKGFTQEELVDKCNISVRTIQRIEAGEVTPRSYTIKTILSVLDYDLETIAKEEPKVAKEFKKLFLLDIDNDKEASFLTKHLNIAWICGIIYLLLGFPEAAIDLIFFKEGTLSVSQPLYIVLKIGVITSLLFFMKGFILTGKILNNYLLRITASIFIFASGIVYLFDIISLFTEGINYESVMVAEAIVFGIIGILFGISVLRLKNALGSIAQITGVFEIITFSLILTVVLALAGFVLMIPTTILEIILLFKVTQMVKAKIRETEEG